MLRLTLLSVGFLIFGIGASSFAKEPPFIQENYSDNLTGLRFESSHQASIEIAPIETSINSSQVARWKFNDGSGNKIRDSSSNSYHASIYGNAQWTAGESSGALQFDGIDDRVAVPDLDTSPHAEFGNLDYGTIVIRFKYSGINNGNQNAEILPIFFFGQADYLTPTTAANDLMIYIGHGRITDPQLRPIYFTVHLNGGVALCFDSGLISLEEGVWYHYAVVISPQGHKGYLNGVEFERHYNAGTGPDDYAFFTTVPSQEMLSMGYGRFARYRQWWFHNGIIDDLAIYNRALIEEEIISLYNEEEDNPVPTITSLSPASATAGGSAFTLTVNGIGFVDGASTVFWNELDRATTFVSSTQLTASISAADVATAGTAGVTVYNSVPGGGHFEH